MRKRAFITGASSPIGRALACEFARGGFDLFMTGRKTSVLRRNAAELRKQFAVEFDYLSADLADKVSTDGLISAISKLDFDVLVNIPESEYASLYEADSDKRSALLHSRLWSAVSLTNQVLGRMVRLGSGRILNVTPPFRIGNTPIEHFSQFYRSTMIAYSTAIANELTPYGITVTVGCLGSLEPSSIFLNKRNTLRDGKLIARTLYKETLNGKGFASA